MRKKKSKRPVRNQNRTAGLRAVEVRELEMISGVEEASGIGNIDATIEDAMEDIYLVDYGGSD